MAFRVHEPCTPIPQNEHRSHRMNSHPTPGGYTVGWVFILLDGCSFCGMGAHSVGWVFILWDGAICALLFGFLSAMRTPIVKKTGTAQQ